MTLVSAIRARCSSQPKAKPKTMPPAASSPLSRVAEKKRADEDGRSEHQDRERPARQRQLQGAADAMTAGAAAGEPRAIHFQRAADEGSSEAKRYRAAEALPPDSRHGLDV